MTKTHELESTFQPRSCEVEIMKTVFKSDIRAKLKAVLSWARVA